MRTEHEEQRDFVQWFRQQHSKVKIFAIPNGGARSSSQGAKLKAEGVSRGVPDLCIPEWHLWVEMKREKGGVVSSEQQEWIDYLSAIGYVCAVCNGFEDAKKMVTEFIERMGEK